MKITLSFEKSLEENASSFFEKAKQARKKITKVEETIARFEKKAAKEKLDESFESSFRKIEHQKKHWYEKFKWTLTREGFLVIAGRDATSNEIIIKKHTQEGDLVFHLEMAGILFVVIKKNCADDITPLLGVTLPNEIGQESIQDAANFTAIHSKAWKNGMSTTDVFYVQPDQVTKEANAGESLSRGSFVIRGKTTYVPVTIQLAIGIVQEKSEFVLGGTKEVVERFCKARVLIEQGKEKTSQVARAIRSQLRQETELDTDIDELVRMLPSGGCQVKKERTRK